MKAICKTVVEHAETSTSEEMTHAQFMAAENFGTLSGNDLYWILRRAASESNSGEEFGSNLNMLFNERLGSQQKFVMGLDSSSFWIPDAYPFPNSMCWGGQAGVLPNFPHGVQILVWW